MVMKQPYTLPDPKDRSTNEPMFLVNPTKILGLYNQSHCTPSRRIDDNVLNWYADLAVRNGWTDVKITGHQIILSIHKVVH